jgi:hypothetical protein
VSSYQSPSEDRRQRDSTNQHQEGGPAAVPTGSASRSLRAYQLDRITIRDITQKLFMSVLHDLAPEIAESCGEYLFEMLIRGEALLPEVVSSGYFAASPYRVDHNLVFEIGEGTVREERRILSIEKCVLYDAPPIITLSAQQGVVELELDLSSEQLSGKWEWADRIGDAVGIDTLAYRFAYAPLEAECFDSDGVRISVSEQVILETTLKDTQPDALPDESFWKDYARAKSFWLPTSLQCRDPDLVDAQTILSMIDPSNGDVLAGSGIVEFGQTFVSDVAPELSMTSLRKIAQALPFKAHVEVSRSISLGYLDESVSEDRAFELEQLLSPEQEGDEPFTSWEPEIVHQDEDSFDDASSTHEKWAAEESDEDGSWSSDGDDRRVCSQVTIQGLSGLRGAYSVVLSSRAALEGQCSLGTSQSEARRFECDGQFIGVVLEHDAERVHPNEAQNRFALFRRIAQRLGLSRFPSKDKLTPDLETSRERALRDDIVTTVDFGVDYVQERLMVYMKRFLWPTR